MEMYKINAVFRPANTTSRLLSRLSGKESACQAKDAGLIPGTGRSPEEEMATPSRVLVWRIPWAEPGGLQSLGSQSQTRVSD